MESRSTRRVSRDPQAKEFPSNNDDADDDTNNCLVKHDSSNNTAAVAVEAEADTLEDNLLNDSDQEFLTIIEKNAQALDKVENLYFHSSVKSFENKSILSQSSPRSETLSLINESFYVSDDTSVQLSPTLVSYDSPLDETAMESEERRQRKRFAQCNDDDDDDDNDDGDDGKQAIPTKKKKEDTA